MDIQERVHGRKSGYASRKFIAQDFVTRKGSLLSRENATRGTNVTVIIFLPLSLHHIAANNAVSTARAQKI